MTTIAARQVAVRLRDRQVLDDVSFAISQPGLTVVLGPNGAGKSTLLRALAGLVVLQRGSIEIGDCSLSAMTGGERARVIGYLPQERTVHWALSARKVVELGRLPHLPAGASLGAADHAAVDAALVAADAVSLADRSTLELSGGERARVLIARVFAQEPAVVVADEPTAGLDPVHQWALFEGLEEAAARGTRIVVALHDLTLASRFARHVLLLAEGRLVAAGTPNDVLTQQRITEIFGVEVLAVERNGRRLVVPVGRVA